MPKLKLILVIVTSFTLFSHSSCNNDAQPTSCEYWPSRVSSVDWLTDIYLNTPTTLSNYTLDEKVYRWRNEANEFFYSIYGVENGVPTAFMFDCEGNIVVTTYNSQYPAGTEFQGEYSAPLGSRTITNDLFL